MSGFRAKISQSGNAGQSPSVASLAYGEASSASGRKSRSDKKR